MSATFKVHWASIAEEDLKNIIMYVADDSPANARIIFNKIRESAANLTQFPERGRIGPELLDQGISFYRELIVAPWRLIYRILDKKVYVLAIIDSRQNVEDILLKRLIK